MTEMWLVTRYCKVVPDFIAKIQADPKAIDECAFHAIVPVEGTRICKTCDEAVAYARACNRDLHKGKDNGDGSFAIDIAPYTDYGVTPITVDPNGMIGRGQGRAWIEGAD